MPLEQMLDFWAVRLDGPKAADVDLSLRFVLSDTADNVLVTVRNGVLNYDMDKADASAALTLTLTRAVFNEVCIWERPRSPNPSRPERQKLWEISPNWRRSSRCWRTSICGSISSRRDWSTP